MNASNHTTPQNLHEPIEIALRDRVRDQLPATLSDLGDLVRIPSVAWDGFDHDHVRASAEAIAALAEGTGVFDSVTISRAPIEGSEELGQPAVLATRAARNGAPTVVLYAHHDVQPPGDDAEWNTPVYEPTVVGDRLYGRGSADDKAGVMSHIGAIRALRAAAGDDFDLGITLFIEGEEEFGSRSFANFLAQHRTELAGDAIIVADSANWDTETPALTVGLRGNVTLRLTVRTLDHASHSGMFGGAVPDAMLATFRLLNTLWDDAGSVAVPGLLVREAETPAYDEAQLRLETGLSEGVSPIGDGTILSRIWDKPAITVTGIDAPSMKNASNTLVPAVTVRVSVRIAPGQDPQAALEAITTHLHANAPFGAQLSIDDADTGSPFLVDTTHPIVATAKQAMADAWEVAPVELGIGGSIPFVADLVREFPAAAILITGVEDPHSRAHSPNESLHLGVFHRATLTEALLLARLNRHGA
ncbi:dipeptidase [Mycetocola tolaasinivorans]|uniref:Dipeptidase n=1 Tax=Mycetocola tolaasinivorans TaxID=76635 RepID=A0A3L7AEL2_9MICO|nr:dipeptidase [Mycetocola tolaasinivorans]RLP78081.1 dipeptidase [Mycetocola tolaasinivorans]